MLALLIAGCGEIEGEEGEEGEEGGSTLLKQGWHFQGRDCLGCHNVDLQRERHLLVAGTLFKGKEVQDPDDLSLACGGKLYLQLLDKSFNTIYDSRDYRDDNSRGTRGKGNLFILLRKLNYLNGEYYVRIITEDGTTVAQSATLHRFTDINSYDPRKNPYDSANRFSCNTCHRFPDPQGGAPGWLYPQNKSSCK